MKLRSLLVLFLFICKSFSIEAEVVKFHSNLGFLISKDNVGPTIFAGVELKEKHLLGAFLHITDKNYFTDYDYNSRDATSMFGASIRYFWKPLSINNILNAYIGGEAGWMLQKSSEFSTDGDHFYLGGVNARLEVGKEVVHTYYNIGMLIGSGYMITQEFGLSICL